MKTKKYRIWDYFPAQTIEEWEMQYKRLYTQAAIIPYEDRKKSEHKDLFLTMLQIKIFLQSKGVKFI